MELVLTLLCLLRLLQAVKPERDAPCCLCAKTKAAQTLPLQRQDKLGVSTAHSLWRQQADPSENRGTPPGAHTPVGTVSPFPAAHRKQGQKGQAVPGCAEGRT